MDLGLYFVIAGIIAFATWLVGVIWGYKTKRAIITIGVIAAILPVVIIFIASWLGMLQEPGSDGEIASKTIEAIIDYMANRLPYIYISDMAGVLVGVVVGLFTKRSD